MSGVALLTLAKSQNDLIETKICYIQEGCDNFTPFFLVVSFRFVIRYLLLFVFRDIHPDCIPHFVCVHFASITFLCLSFLDWPIFFVRWFASTPNHLRLSNKTIHLFVVNAFGYSMRKTCHVMSVINNNYNVKCK